MTHQIYVVYVCVVCVGVYPSINEYVFPIDKTRPHTQKTGVPNQKHKRIYIRVYKRVKTHQKHEIRVYIQIKRKF